VAGSAVIGAVPLASAAFRRVALGFVFAGSPSALAFGSAAGVGSAAFDSASLDSVSAFGFRLFAVVFRAGRGAVSVATAFASAADSAASDARGSS
jgi:hypothetical protein